MPYSEINLSDKEEEILKKYAKAALRSPRSSSGRTTRCMRLRTFGATPKHTPIPLSYLTRLIKYIAANIPIITDNNSKQGIGVGVGTLLTEIRSDEKGI